MNTEKAVRDFLKGVSETSRVYFVGSTLKNAIGYAPGEPIIFKLKVKTETDDVPVPYIHYTCEGEDGQRSEGYASPAGDGWFYFETSIQRDGFVHVIARACDEHKNEIEGIDIFEGGAGVDISKITTGTEEPEDYLAFWDSLKAEIDRTTPDILLEEAFFDDRFPDFELRHMRIRVSGDNFATFSMTYPKGAQRGTLALRVITHGYGFCDVCDVTNCIRENTLTVFISAHAILGRQASSYYEALSEGTLKGFGFDNEENRRPETTYWTKMFMRDLQVIRFIKDHPLLNGREVLFTGGSMGGMRACNLAAHSGIATQCNLDIPWLCDLGGHKNCHRLYGWRPDYENGLRYFDTAIAAKYLTCPVSITAGLGDYVCPPSGEAALYNALTVPKSIVFIQNQTHPYRPFEAPKYQLCSD